MGLQLILILAFAQPQDLEISVNGSRPLAKIAGEIERVTGTAVDYEDVRYLGPTDVIDVTDSVARSPSQIPIVAPRGGAISVPLRTNDVSAAISAAISQYAAKGLPGAFTLRKVDGRLVIGPQDDRDAVLATQVSFLFDSRTAPETLDIILAEVTRKTGIRVVAGMALEGGFSPQFVSLGAKDTPAQDAIHSLFEQLHINTSSRLFYDPTLRFYAFNVRAAAPETSGYNRVSGPPSLRCRTCGRAVPSR